MKVRPHANAKKKTERLKGFKFRIFIGHFQRQRGSEGVNGGGMVFSGDMDRSPLAWCVLG